MKSTLTNGVGCEGWMSELPDDVLLSKLSIPGTHNSMSYTCYEANIILKIIPAFLNWEKTDSQNWLVKS